MYIELKNVNKKYGDFKASDNVSFSIEKGKLIGLLGPSGSGKTTILRMIAGLEKPDSGNVELLGDYKYAWINTGVVFQEDRLCEDFPAAENVALVGRNTSPAIALEEMEKLITPEIYKRIRSKTFSPQDKMKSSNENGSTHDVRTALSSLPVRDLPAPLRRLICIVRACIIPSDVLVMDEPFAGLDDDTRRAAITYIRSRAELLGIDPEFYKNKDIHIHFPEAAVPKDGPSAGITMCIAVISALSGKPVRGDIAMTGEISLRGRVLPIGGLREKTMAALRAGVSTVIIPKENESDLEEIDPLVRARLNFVAVEHADEVLNLVFPQQGGEGQR